MYYCLVLELEKIFIMVNSKLGIDVSNSRQVTLNISHDNRVVTSISKNPKLSMIGRSPKTPVYSIYMRTKSGDYSRDGNPLMYALKGINNYSISLRELYNFRSSFVHILNAIHSNLLQGNKVVVAMPSSSSVVGLFAKRVSRRFGAQMIDLFLKCTVQEVLNNFHANFSLKNIKKSDKFEVQRLLAALSRAVPNSFFSMKIVPNKIRKYFNPIKLNPQANLASLNGAQIILVDDLLSSGITLICAIEILMSLNLPSTAGVCLLSDLN